METVTGVLVFLMAVGLLALLVGGLLYAVLDSVVVLAGGAVAFVLAGLGTLVCNATPAGRRNTAWYQAITEKQTAARAAESDRAERERRTAERREAERREREAEDARKRAVRELLDGLPERGAPQEEAIAYCLSRTSAARDPRIHAEARKLARRHIAVDERILCVARSMTYRDRERPALLILTDRGAAVSDKGTSYRFDPGPEDVFDPVPDPAWGHLEVGELRFPFRDNPDLRIALLAREEAAATPPPAAPRADRPRSRLVRTARDAELTAVEWMRYLGFTDAVATPVGADEGVDVIAERGLAQVKMEGVPTGRPVVQQLYGVAVAQGRAGLFFSLAGYTPQAADWASRHGIALFRYDLQGTPEPVNPPALRLLEAADSGAPRPPEEDPSPEEDLDEPPAPGTPVDEAFARHAEDAGLEAELLRDIARTVVAERNAGIAYVQRRFSLSRPAARRALQALEHLDLVSAPAGNGRRTVTATSLDHLVPPNER
ncbi:restriction endonuclease [Streptomyces macrosporus]|uniref:FtsK gamma domain-containing protein n=1 Tax=Streptomyces macrosporus TaxID=44032 RepID=A0ABP5WUV9_9ACTN